MPNQPMPEKSGLVGFLTPTNDVAVDAMKAAARERISHHSNFFHDAKDEDDNVVPSFIISIDRRPLYRNPTGWIIGTGDEETRSWGVDFLLKGAPNVEAQHVSFGWAPTAGGFYLHGTTEGDGKLALRIDGKTVGRSQRHLLTYTNTIDIGGCQFRRQFDDKTPEEQVEFKGRLEAYSREYLDNSDPMIDRTPTSDKPEEWFGKFFVNEEIRKSVNGVEKRVTHSTRAAVYIIRVITQPIQNITEYDRELKVARKVETMEHIKIAFIRGVKEELIERKFVWTQAPDTILRKAWWILPYFPQNLRAYIPQGEDGPTCDVTESTAQILEGVAYLHSHDIVHRDLRPENIAVADTRPLQLKITDFAAADAERHFYEATSYMNLDHINHYAAPELRLCGYGKPYRLRTAVTLVLLTSGRAASL